MNINCTEAQYERMIQALSNPVFSKDGECFFGMSPKNCAVLLGGKTEHTCTDCLRKNIKRVDPKADVEKLTAFVLRTLEDIEPYIYGGDERSDDLMDCGYADAEWNTWICVLDQLGVKHNYETVEE